MVRMVRKVLQKLNLKEDEIRYLLGSVRTQGTFWQGVGFIGGSTSLSGFKVDKDHRLVWRWIDKPRITFDTQLPFNTEITVKTSFFNGGFVTRKEYQRFVLWEGITGIHMLEPQRPTQSK